MPTIAVDAMGGDHAPDAVVQGVAQVSLATDIECLLVGDERRIQNVLERVSYNPEHIAILHATEAIGMAEEPREAVKRRDSSLLVGVRAVAEGRADAIVSAGNTGAAVLACAKHFRLLRGIRRAALASVYPRQREHRGQDPLALLLDVGATVRCEAEELVHFALMGSAYARRISKVASPAVGLLNMGREEVKGGDVLVEAHRRQGGRQGGARPRAARDRRRAGGGAMRLGRARPGPTPPASAAPLFSRWDLDKTYLRSEFDSLRSLLRTAFERAEDKVEVPGVAELIRALKAAAERHGRKALVYFVSASPPQIGAAIRKKLALDRKSTRLNSSHL